MTNTTAALLSFKTVMARTSLSRSTIDRLTRSGSFPPKVCISARRRGFPEDKVAAWIASRSQAAQ